MARSISSQKRMRQNARRQIRNKAHKSALKTEVRKLTEALSSGNAAGAGDLYRKAAKALDQKAAKGVIHKNAAARRKSRLAKRVNALKGAKKA